jgi:transposase
MPPRRGKELTEYTKGRIESRGACGQTHAQIGHELHVPRTTVTSTLNRIYSRSSPKNLPHTGRPRKSSESHDRLLVRNCTAPGNTRIPLGELRSKINETELSVSTIRRRLKEAGIRKWKAADRVLLTKEHAWKRLKWAKAHQHWLRPQWDKLIVSDESSVRRDSNHQTVWVFRRQNKQERNAPHNVKTKSKESWISVMMWGCFAGTKLGPIAFVDGHPDSNQYINLLSENLIPFIEKRTANGVTDMIFQQDNASFHSSKETRQFFDATSPDFNFTIMEWPPNSPDMNPIEHLWPVVKNELFRRFPDTSTLRGGCAKVKSELKSRLTVVWDDIEEEVLDRLIASMPKRVSALLKAEGWYTDY